MRLLTQRSRLLALHDVNSITSQIQIQSMPSPIPALGFGTAAIGQWQQDDDYVKNTVLKAIEAVYRHIDTASICGNERSVGAAIRESGIVREAFYVVSKVWSTEQGFEATQAACQRSLRRLGLDYLDLYLIHWPFPERTVATWGAMETLISNQQIRSADLSNFGESDIEDVMEVADHYPVCNQLELHPYFQQPALAEYTSEERIAVSCWSPLGTGSWSDVPTAAKPLADDLIRSLAEKHRVGAAQVIIKWNLQHGRIVIPKSETPQNMRSNLAVESFELTDEERSAIDALDKKQRFGRDPDTVHDAAMAMTVPD